MSTCPHGDGKVPLVLKKAEAGRHGVDHAGTPPRLPTGFPLTCQNYFSMLPSKGEFEAQFSRTLVAQFLKKI